MKKLFVMVVTLIVALSCTNVKAMTEDELKAKLTQEFDINGTKVKIEDSYATQIERYLNENEISSTDADYIASKVDELITMARNTNATKMSDFTAAEKNQVVAMINDVSNKTSVKATVDKGVVTIYNADGTVFTKASNVIKRTGMNNIIVLASAIVVLGVCLIARKVKNA